MVNANKLIEWFYYMYNCNWGYIFGKSGQLWTQKMQDKATNEMAKKYGSRWIGHYVTDCSGAFVYAFKKEGASIYHGSDTIYKKYCSAKGKLVKGVPEDGHAMKPGTAVFLYGGDKNNYHHVGLYVGNDTCIEAKGTLYGVTVSRLSHWTHWGELKDVDYSDVKPIEVGPQSDGVGTRLLRRGCKGDDVKALQAALNKWNNGYEALAVDGAFGSLTEAAVKIFQADSGLKADGIVGPQTWKALEPYLQKEEDPEPAPQPVPDPKTVKIAVTLVIPDDYKDTYTSFFEEWLEACPFIIKEWNVEWSVMDNA